MTIQLNPLASTEQKNLCDIKWGYGRVHQDARKKFTRSASMVFGDLNSERVEKFKIFSEDECAEFRKRLDAGEDILADRAETMKIMERVFNPELDARLISYFNSEYVPEGVQFEKILPTETPHHSDCWHCDGGPSKQVVMIIYLSPSEADAANTVFTDPTNTDYLKALGYLFCPIDARVDDLTPLYDHYGLAHLEEKTFEMTAGDAVVFQAANIMHKRSLPKIDPRYVLVVCVLPSPLPWREACEVKEKPFKIGDRETFEQIPEDQLP